MKSILYTSNNKWENVNVIEEKNTDKKLVKVKVKYCGICGSDLHRIFSPAEINKKIPLGHEIFGFIDSDNCKYTLGTPVVINPIINCKKCDNCKNGLTQFCDNSLNLGKNFNGGYSDYVYVKEDFIYPLTDTFTPTLAVLVDGVAVAVHAFKGIEDNKKIKSVLVIGDGTIAAISIVVLNILYPKIDIYLKGKNILNMEYLKSKYSINLDEVEDSSVDLSIETVGRSQSDTLNYGISKTAINGNILVFGVYPEGFISSTNIRPLFYKEITLKGINSFVSFEDQDDFKDAINIIENNQDLFDGIVTHSFTMEDFEEALKTIKDKGNQPVLKVILEN